MLKNFISLILLMACGCVFAQTGNVLPDSTKQTPAAFCAAAKDSVKNRLLRAETGFYNPVKYQPGAYHFILISKKKYSRAQFLQAPDSNFIHCYNKGIKKTMDSIYKVDFFKKADSILNSYDKTGRGYSNADFPGGAGALQKFQEKNVTLPKEIKADDGSPSLRVFYSFIVDETGVISDIKLMKSNCKACEEPVLDAIKKFPLFTPAYEAGVTKKIRYILPFTRALKK